MRVLFISSQREWTARKRVFNATALTAHWQCEFWNALMWHPPQRNAVHDVLRDKT